jgi:hypothetical protein
MTKIRTINFGSHEETATEVYDGENDTPCPDCQGDDPHHGTVRTEIDGVWEGVGACNGCGEPYEIGRTPGTMPSFIALGGRLVQAPMDLAEQLQLIDEHPELAPLVDLSAPVWCQLGTHDRLVFDLSAERHGSVDHKAQLYGEACVWKELGLESFPGEHRPAADVALETRLGRIEVCTLRKAKAESSSSAAEAVVLLDHRADPSFDLVILVHWDDQSGRGHLLGWLRVAEIIHAPIMPIAGRRVHVSTGLTEIAELIHLWNELDADDRALVD